MSIPVGRSLRPVSALLLALGLCATAPGAGAQTIVNSFPPKPAAAADLVPGTWYNWYSTGAGVPAVVSLSGQGGTLEANQPLPTGAALLLTQAADADRTNVGVYDVLGGTVGEVFPTLNIAYEFYKKSNPGQNLNAAAALKLEIFNPTCDETPGGDCYATLIWEPYQNGFGNWPAQDVWHQATITPTSGTFWSSGGFGRPNGFGGCPCLTLSQYLAQSTPDFAQARVVSLQIGVGSYNRGQIAYFDDLRISHSFGAGLNLAYDFELLIPVAIDLRPGSTSNQINTNAKQLVPIAILGSSTFDPIAEVDPDSVLVLLPRARSREAERRRVRRSGRRDRAHRRHPRRHADLGLRPRRLAGSGLPLSPRCVHSRPGRHPFIATEGCRASLVLRLRHSTPR